MSEMRQWVERFEALRDDLATGDLYHVQKWVQNDGALTEIVEGIARLTAELEEARERERGYREALEANQILLLSLLSVTASAAHPLETRAAIVDLTERNRRTLAATPPAEGGGDE